MCLDAVSWSSLDTPPAHNERWTFTEYQGSSRKLKSYLFVHFNISQPRHLIAVFYTIVKHFETLSTTFQNTIRWKTKLPSHHKAWLTIGDSFIGFSCFCVTQHYQSKGKVPNHCTVQIVKRLTNFLHSHTQAMIRENWLATDSGVHCILCLRTTCVHDPS